MRLEVRCCCQPQKLLGWLPVRDGLKDGDTVVFAVPMRPGRLLDDRKVISRSSQETITLPVATFWEAIPTHVVDGDSRGHYETHLALKSEETPTERLRMIPGFEEAPR